jgi:3-hydroxybutyryl-CoA dehydratase
MNFIDAFIGQKKVLQYSVSPADLAGYIQLTGDTNPLHRDVAFAQKKGFKSAVVHGFFIGGIISRFLGVDFIGENCIIHSVSLQFSKPCYCNEKIEIEGAIVQKTEFGKTLTIVLEVRKYVNSEVLCRGEVQVGILE